MQQQEEARTKNHPRGNVDAEGRGAHDDVPQDLDKHASQPEQHHGPKHRILREPGEELDCVGVVDHLLDQHAFAILARDFEQPVDGACQCVLSGDAEDDAANVALVRQ